MSTNWLNKGCPYRMRTELHHVKGEYEHLPVDYSDGAFEIYRTKVTVSGAWMRTTYRGEVYESNISNDEERILEIKIPTGNN